MGQVAKSQQQARAKARQRRIELDHDRAAHDERVEAAAVEAILALTERDEALGQVSAAEVRVGEALLRIIALGIKVGGVARLCDLSAGEVHRLRRLAQRRRDLGPTHIPPRREPPSTEVPADREKRRRPGVH